MNNRNVNSIHKPEMEWGKLYNPSSEQVTVEIYDGIRILVIGSAFPGYLTMKTLHNAAEWFSKKIVIVGYVTDDPTDPAARISVKKRMWREYSFEERNDLFTLGLDFALLNGIPCYTGSVKSSFFHELIDRWKPEVILVNGLGQKLDSHIINYPIAGIYNFHPSDLAEGLGAGPNPYQDAIERGMSNTRMTIHYVTREFDEGQIIGCSPAINITTAKNGYPRKLVNLHDKVTSVSGWMALILIKYVIEQKSSGNSGKVEYIEFEQYASTSLKSVLINFVSELPETSFREIPNAYLEELIPALGS